MWKAGRQGTGYSKWTLIGMQNFDMHILRYLPGQHIPPHRDKLPDRRRHFRMNILLCGEDSFQSETVIFKWWRFTIFRPDISTHSVPAVSRKRYLLSIGWVW